MNCLVFSESYPLQLKDDDFQIDAVTDSKHLLSSIRAHSFVLILIEARLLCALAVSFQFLGQAFPPAYG